MFHARTFEFFNSISSSARRSGVPTSTQRPAWRSPLTTPRAVKRVYTNLGVFEIVPDKGFVVVDLAPGVTLEQAQAASGAVLHTQ